MSNLVLPYHKIWVSSVKEPTRWYTQQITWISEPWHWVKETRINLKLYTVWFLLYVAFLCVLFDLLVCVCTQQCMYDEWEHNLWKSILFFLCVGSGIWTKVVWLGHGCLYLLSHHVSLCDLENIKDNIGDQSSGCHRIENGIEIAGQSLGG